jgi:hypothetical protein
MLFAIILSYYNHNNDNFKNNTIIYNFALSGCDVVSSAPYCDPDPKENIRIVFELAREFNCPIDLHLGEELSI